MKHLKYSLQGLIGTDMHNMNVLLVVMLLPGFPSILSSQAGNQPTGLAATLLINTSFDFVTLEQGQFRFHYQLRSFAALHLDTLRRDAEKAFHHNLALIQQSRFPGFIDVFYLESRDEMERAIGYSVKGFSDWRSRTVLIVVNEEVRAYHKHEIMHVLSSNLWGFPADSNHCFLEGLAVFADSPCLGYSLHEIAAFMEYNGELIPLETMFKRFRQQADVPSYLQGGSVVEYLIEAYGLEVFKRIWMEGIQELDHILGISLDKLEADYRRFLKGRFPRKPEVPWETLLERGCG